MKNWWYYHKWYAIGGIILLLISFNLLSNYFGWFRQKPDFQIAYIGESALPDDTVSAIEKAFSSLADDYNHDGHIVIQVNQYVTGDLNDNSADTAEYRQASELRLLSDINDCESYFFLLEDPETFQNQYQLLADSDGSCPASSDYSASGKVLVWDTITPFNSMDLGTYESTLLGQKITGSNQEFLSSFYLGRRCFYTSAETENTDGCDALWKKLSKTNNN